MRFTSILVSLLTATSLHAQSLLENGNFDNPTDPFKGWVTDYAWTGNQNYAENKNHLTLATDEGRKCVNFAKNGDGGTKMETLPILFEPGFKYSCDIDIKGTACRVYFAGYQWLPGIHPHDNPALTELRKIYQSKAAIVSSPTWINAHLELPGVVLSDDAKAHLSKIRYLTLYIWMLNGGAVSHVTVKKIADPTMAF